MADNGPILVTGAAGQLGAVGRTVTNLLLERGLRVRAMVRREDERAAVLRAAGADVMVGDLLEPADVYRVVNGCRRIYFGMSVNAAYLEATVIMAAVAREVGADALVNMSQMTVSQMSIQNSTPSHQQRQQWLGEQGHNWLRPILRERISGCSCTLAPMAQVSSSVAWATTCSSAMPPTISSRVAYR
jgi:NAD(P)H dehydrogenase (quinone)